MSSLTPQPPTSAPPPPPPPGAPDAAVGLPWERRQQLGFGPAFLETVRLIATQPGAAFAQMRETGDIFESLIFGVIVGWVGGALGLIWRMILPAPFMFLPGPMREKLAGMGFLAGTSVASLLLLPFLLAVVLFIMAAILHLFLLIFGGLTSSRSGFEGTFRVAAYSDVADLANVIPFVGALIAFVWKVVLLVLGLTRIHRTTQGRAAAAVLVPFVLCCVCIGLGILVGVAAIASAFGRH